TLIEAVHADYFAAGADIALTASYQATFAGFGARGIDADATRGLLQLAVDLAARARDRHLAGSPAAANRPLPLIGASIGAFGAHRHDGSEYRGDYGVSAATIGDFHRRQVEVLAAAGADFIAFETIPCRLEIEAILRLLEDFPGIPAWISFSCRNGEQNSHGEDFGDCVALVAESPSVIATGINCTAPEFVESLLRTARTRCTLPLFAYPNSGETWHAQSGCWHGNASAGSLSAEVRRWLAAGATLLGGCCRTTPADIAEIARAIRGG
ncbi:MAG: homocysteine S-methyltransferase, partial [Gammaproteobacteria bacterium]